ncbi:hypothetical protein GCM10011374_30470 [Kocuria dechangensis]|uniref:Uncharacterized protein n=1 Tax=Kocuria dechangensis TaxID=1176249 RepID=A0A917LX30_9MICC|nr:hypothetical protein [Kocuria dechangensis]GGG64692.1 hypothetical protein GCM10011374_30470 [Kocuria dechangensis]
MNDNQPRSTDGRSGSHSPTENDLDPSTTTGQELPRWSLRLQGGPQALETLRIPDQMRGSVAARSAKTWKVSFPTRRGRESYTIMAAGPHLAIQAAFDLAQVDERQRALVEQHVSIVEVIPVRQDKVDGAGR